MNRKAILAIFLAALVPLVSYLLVKYYSTEAVQMPHRYFFDSVAVVEKMEKCPAIPSGIPLRISRLQTSLAKGILK